MNETFCKICESKNAKYNCPRCNIPYCSVECYKSQRHLECSEGFFRENVFEELSLRDTDTSGAKSMLDILQRIEQTDTAEEELSEHDDEGSQPEELDSDDEEQENELATRLEGIDLENADSVWEKLTNAEKQDFQNLVESGNITKVLPELDIWWERDYGVGLIQPNNECSLEEEALLQACPKLCTKIPNFNDIFNKEPSPMVRHNIANVLAAYAFVHRLFFGDIHESTLEATDCLLAICLNLSKNAVYDSESLAVQSVIHECRNNQLPTNDETTSILRNDVRKIFAGPNNCGKRFKKLFLLASLSDIRSLLARANRGVKHAQEQKKLNVLQKPSGSQPIHTETSCELADLKHIDGPLIRSCQKKMDFYLAYANSCCA